MPGPGSPIATASDGYGPLETEQLERVKQRDGMLNLTIVAIAVLSGLAVQGPRQAVAWLVIPWVTTIVGWAYLSNDDKVSAIAAHLRRGRPAGEPSWETGEKGFIPVRLRRAAEATVFVATFGLPVPASIALYAAQSGAARRWAAHVLVIVGIEVGCDARPDHAVLPVPAPAATAGPGPGASGTSRSGSPG